jgi:MFS family permease
MWWLAAGFFLVTGPGEAFINNLGTIIGSLYPRTSLSLSSEVPHTSPATHVSIVAVTSTVARIIAGTVSDLLAPASDGHQHRRGPDSLYSSLASLDPLSASNQSFSQHSGRRFTVSRVTFLLLSTLLLSLGQILLASGLVQDHASARFWIVSASIGAGYGACFSLVPIIISCVWGVENFGTNWGVVAVVPAGGAAVWGGIYAMVYEWAARTSMPDDEERNGDERCYGVLCYQITFGAMTICVWIACTLWIWAWRGPGGWRRRGIQV